MGKHRELKILRQVCPVGSSPPRPTRVFLLNTGGEIYSTPELEKAYEQAEAAWSEYRTARQEVIRISQTIGEGDPLHPLMRGPFSDAIKRVQVIDQPCKWVVGFTSFPGRPKKRNRQAIGGPLSIANP